jgi:predicted nuclease with RNAse H fold
MSILQIELPEDVRQKIEAQAQSQGRDAGSWLLELAERELRSSQDEDAERRYIESELLKALDSPLQVADDAWWQKLEQEALARIDNAK